MIFKNLCWLYWLNLKCWANLAYLEWIILGHVIWQFFTLLDSICWFFQGFLCLWSCETLVYGFSLLYHYLLFTLHLLLEEILENWCYVFLQCLLEFAREVKRFWWFSGLHGYCYNSTFNQYSIIQVIYLFCVNLGSLCLLGIGPFYLNNQICRPRAIYCISSLSF